MSQSEVLKVAVRTAVGSRDARKLRRQGRIPASLQTDGDKASHLNLHVDEVAFLASRRHHIHLYDLDIDGDVHSALVRELQWDALGDRVNHIEFKRVERGVETEAEVELDFFGVPKHGILNHLVTHITIKTLPSNIPDSILVKIGDLEVGDHIKAGELEMPEGVTLAVPEDLEILVLSAPRAEVEEVPEGEEAEAAGGEGGAAPETPDAPGTDEG